MEISVDRRKFNLMCFTVINTNTRKKKQNVLSVCMHIYEFILGPYLLPHIIFSSTFNFYSYMGIELK